MPTDQQSLIRRKTIDRCLRDTAHRYGKQDLMRACQKALEKRDIVGACCSERTIQGDLKWLREGGAEIVQEKDGVMHYRYADPSYSFFEDEDTLSDTTKQDIADLLGLLAQYANSDTMQWIEEIRSRLMSELYIAESSPAISFDENDSLLGAGYLSALYRAIRDRIVVGIKYRSFENVVHEGLFSPQYLKQYNGRWFLFCVDHADGQLYNKALDRIQQLEIEPLADYVDSGIDFTAYFDDLVGVTKKAGAKKERVVFWVSDVSYKYVDTKPIYSWQKHVVGDEEKELRKRYGSLRGGRFYKMDIIVNRELENILASLGSELVVIEPQWLRQSFCEKIARLAALYEADEQLEPADNK